MRSHTKWLIIGGVILLGAGGLMWIGKNGLPSSSNDSPLTVTESDWTRGGGADSVVTLVEYADFQCPACGAYHPLLKQLQADFGTNVRFVFRHFPLTNAHPNAIPAALAAEAAGKQGKFWEMQDVLFEKQTEWAGNADAKNLFAEYAVALELDRATFMADMENDATLDKVQSQFREGLSLGVNSTPTFFLNGKKLVNPNTYESFRALLIEKGAVVQLASTTEAI